MPAKAMPKVACPVCNLQLTAGEEFENHRMTHPEKGSHEGEEWSFRFPLIPAWYGAGAEDHGFKEF